MDRAGRALDHGVVILALTQQPSALWFFARAAGFTSLILLSLSVSLGVAVSLRLRSNRWPTFINDGLHRYVTTVLFVFLAIHVITIWLDPFTRFRLDEVLLPFVSSYRTFWMGLGIAAMELAAAFALSIYLRGAMGYRAWRTMHYLTYLVFPLAWLHGVGTGSDSHTWWGAAIYGLTIGPVVVLAIARWLTWATTVESSGDAAGERGSQQLLQR